jgi:hypothetical protein
MPAAVRALLLLLLLPPAAKHALLQLVACCACAPWLLSLAVRVLSLRAAASCAHASAPAASRGLRC